MDETPVQVLNEQGKSAEPKSYMWVRYAGRQINESRCLITTQVEVARFQGGYSPVMPER
jgi:hypothetical protein